MANRILCKCALVTLDGKRYHISNMLGATSCIETGKHMNQSRRDFCKWIKTVGGIMLPDLKNGQYIDIRTGEVNNLYGI